MNEGKERYAEYVRFFDSATVVSQASVWKTPPVVLLGHPL